MSNLPELTHDQMLCVSGGATLCSSTLGNIVCGVIAGAIVEAAKGIADSATSGSTNIDYGGYGDLANSGIAA